jgi:hypothetical protein
VDSIVSEISVIQYDFFPISTNEMERLIAIPDLTSLVLRWLFQSFDIFITDTKSMLVRSDL